MRLFGELVRSLLRSRDAEVEWLRARVEALEAMVLEMRRAGYNPTPSAPAGAAGGGLPERIAYKIAALARGNRALERELEDYARGELSQGTEEELVVAALGDGGRPDAVYD